MKGTMKKGKKRRGDRVKIGIVGVGRMGTYHANVLSILNHSAFVLIVQVKSF